MCRGNTNTDEDVGCKHYKSKKGTSKKECCTHPMMCCKADGFKPTWRNECGQKTKGAGKEDTSGHVDQTKQVDDDKCQ